jgi:hypothetical protein
MDTNVYLQILQEHLIPFSLNTLGFNSYLIQDNDPKILQMFEKTYFLILA